ncbi:MAG: DEAD/DEAH box helicase [Phycisphaerales bacterium]
MTLSPLDAEPHAFTLLAAGVQRQLYSMGWLELRAIQAKAIRAYVATDADLLIMAETAGGKTEAAFLPVLSAISAEPIGSVRAMYVGPLKALINDQFGRLEDLCTHLDVNVHRWHGDVSASQKAALVKEPSGVLLITPESLESLLINRTRHLGDLFGGLRAVVIDEVHAFLSGERGLHLASLLSRVRRYVRQDQRRPRMLGLSATVGDPSAAQRYLNPSDPRHVSIITDDGPGKEIKFRIHGYVKDTDGDEGAEDQVVVGADPATAPDADLVTMQRIAQDLAEHCRTHSNLVFANAKGDIELYADMANECCRNDGLPESFLVHHGSLAKEVREDTEATMKGGRAMTTVCSSTLEMGIDIGSVWMVGQIGAPWSVASFKQRLGRSGRKDGEPRRLRGYVICEDRTNEKDPLSQLPLELLQTVAICELMLRQWVEPPAPSAIDLSTLAHQMISTVAETGAIDASSLQQRLCHDGPFVHFDKPMFAAVLRNLGAVDVLEQGPDGSLILGLEGERLRAQKDFYAAFASRIEFTIIAGDRTLGSLPIDTVPKVGEHLVFAARRWQVIDVDAARMSLYVTPAKRRQRPVFTGGLGDIHPKIRDEMLAVLAGQTTYPYLDQTSAEALDLARHTARTRGLGRRALIDLTSDRCLWLTWTGTRQHRTCLALLSWAGVEAIDRQVAIEGRASVGDVRRILTDAVKSPPALRDLAQMIAPKQFRKFDYLFAEDLLNESIAADRLDERWMDVVAAVASD